MEICIYSSSFHSYVKFPWARYWDCDGQCISKSNACNGVCPEDRISCGTGTDRCLTPEEAEMESGSVSTNESAGMLATDQSEAAKLTPIPSLYR